jgi:hypothetical protein
MEADGVQGVEGEERQGWNVLDFDFGRTGVSDTEGCPLSGLGDGLKTAQRDLRHILYLQSDEIDGCKEGSEYARARRVWCLGWRVEGMELDSDRWCWMHAVEGRVRDERDDAETLSQTAARRASA